ncbi:MAG: GTP-binding protein [Candidatus Helarchaeota archaeon]
MVNLNKLNTLLNNFIDSINMVEATILMTKEGYIITSIVKDLGEESIGGVTQIVRYISDVITFDPALSEERGIKELSTPEKLFIFRQVDPKIMFCVICNPLINGKIAKAYSEFVAKKIEQLLEDKDIPLEIPKMEPDEKEKEKGKEYVFKICVLGDPGVGKTTSIIQFAQSRFESEYKSTIGVSIIKNDLNIDGDTIHLQIWDIAGQERWAGMRRVYYAGSLGALLLYDVTRVQSFDNLEKWVNEFQTYTSSENPLLMIGNKIDLVQIRKISKEDGEKKASEFGIPYLETSAKTAENINRAYEELARSLIRKISEE